MSKTVTLAVSDFTQIELDFFIQMNWENIPANQDADGPGLICCTVTRQTLRPHRRGILEESGRTIRCRDRLGLEQQVFQEVRHIMKSVQHETDPRRVVSPGHALHKFLHAAMGLYLEEIQDIASSMPLTGEL